MSTENFSNSNKDTLYSSQTSVESEQAPRYLKTLCRHFARKVSSEWDETSGSVQFPAGVCKLALKDEQSRLEIRCYGETQDKLVIVQNILTQHLVMLTKREKDSVIWRANSEIL